MALVGISRIFRPANLFSIIGYESLKIDFDTSKLSSQWIFISSFVYLFSLGLYKFTILLLYLQLFGVDKRFKYTTWTVMFFVFGYLFTNLLTMIFGCTPIDKSWNSTSPGHCVDGMHSSEQILIVQDRRQVPRHFSRATALSTTKDSCLE